MDLSSKAQAASIKGDHKAAIKYFKALARAVPGKAIAYARICREYEALGDRAAALAACHDALGRPGVQVEDFDRTVRLTLDHPGAVTRAEKDDLTEVIKHLRAEPATRASAADMECQLAARAEDNALLENCVRELVVAAPKSARTVTYQWSLALHRGDAGEAAKLIERAKQAGVQPAGIAKMVEATAGMHSKWRGPLTGLLLAVGAAIVGLFVWRARGGQQATRAPA
jgi:predicted Zn-dependent protease